MPSKLGQLEFKLEKKILGLRNMQEKLEKKFFSLIFNAQIIAKMVINFSSVQIFIKDGYDATQNLLSYFMLVKTAVHSVMK